MVICKECYGTGRDQAYYDVNYCKDCKGTGVIGMGKFVEPKTYWIGYTMPEYDGFHKYLVDSGNREFITTYNAAIANGVHPGLALCSFYGKLCYKSLTLGHNDNITMIRDVESNIKNCFLQGHGSVFEHCWLNFVVTDCSRVFTHELVRHRVGTAFSQTSGRYVRGDCLDIVFDPILEEVKEEATELQLVIEQYYNKMVEKMGLNQEKDFNIKKQKTSALRRFLPNGQSNEIGFSCNLRAIRHLVQIRTSEFAEWEIRKIFNQVYQLVKEKIPLLFCDAKEREVKGLLEVYGMKQQPYDYVPTEVGNS